MLQFCTISVIISLRGGESMTKVGELIQKGREENNLSMRQLAELAHVSHSDISRIESGEREVPNPKILRKISKYIGVNYNDLMYASGLGAQISPLNPYIIEHYRKLKGEDLKNAINSIRSNTNNNNILIYFYKWIYIYCSTIIARATFCILIFCFIYFSYYE